MRTGNGTSSERASLTLAVKSCTPILALEEEKSDNHSHPDGDQHQEAYLHPLHHRRLGLRLQGNMRPLPRRANRARCRSISRWRFSGWLDRGLRLTDQVAKSVNGIQ